MSGDGWGWTVVHVTHAYAYPSGVVEETGGSAVLVSEDGWFLTAGHILWRPEGATVARLGVVWPDGSVSDDWDWFRYSTTYPDFGSFLLRWIPRQARPVMTTPTFPRRHEPVWLMGYPESYGGHLFSEPGQFLRPRGDGHSFVFSLDNPLSRGPGGLSGGAVVTQEGKLLGIFAASWQSALTRLIGYPRPLCAGMSADGWERHGWRKAGVAGNVATPKVEVVDMAESRAVGHVGHGPDLLVRASDVAPRGAIVPELVDVSSFAGQLAKYRESGNAIVRWLNSRLSVAQSAQEARMIEGFAAQWRAIQGYYDGVAGALDAAYRAQRAQGKLALAELENARDRQLAELQMHQGIAKQYFESFTLQAASLKEQLLEAGERQRSIQRKQREQDARLTRLEEETAAHVARLRKDTELHVAQVENEIRETREVPQQRRQRRRMEPREIAERLLTTFDDLDEALQHVDRRFGQRDPQLADEVKNDVRELYRQLWRRQLDERQPDAEGGVGDDPGYNVPR